MIVVDASVLANVLATDLASRHRIAALLVPHAPWAVPDLALVETTAGLRRRRRAAGLPRQWLMDAVDELMSLPLEVYGTSALIRRTAELADSLSPYDAVYVGLAEGLGCGLATADRRIASASGVRCSVLVVE